MMVIQDETRRVETRIIKATGVQRTRSIWRPGGVTTVPYPVKGSELLEEHPLRRYKGRVVFRGNQVKTENWEAALFKQMASQPASVLAAKTADAYGCLKGHTIQQADAIGAYTQAPFLDKEAAPTWVRLPEDVWPQAWKDAGMRNPVCRLHRALYGHPLAGGYWERHCEAALRKCGFQPVHEGWKSCFWHPQRKLFLVGYVDDIKLSGPADQMREAWEDIQQHIDIEELTDLDHFLGCNHSYVTLPPGVDARIIKYEMKYFLESCLALYQTLAPSAKLTTVSTPYLPPDPADTNRF